MADFQPVRLADYAQGLVTNKEPFLALPNSFSHIENATVFRSKAQIRPGYELFGTLWASESETVAGTSGKTDIGGTVSPDVPVRAGSFEMTDGTTTFTDDGNGNLSDGGTGTGTIDYTTGAYSTTWSAASLADVDISWEWDQGEPVMGGELFFPQDGGVYLLVANTKRLFRYDESVSRFVDLIGSDMFTGDADNFFWFTPYDNLCFFNNGVDHPKLFDPSGSPTVRDADTTISTGPTVEIESALFTVRHRDRLHYCNTREGGSSFPNRVRRTELFNPEDLTNDKASDEPTNAIIVSGGVLGDDVVLPNDQNETWRYTYLGDPARPYEMVRVSRLNGAVSPYSMVELENTLQFFDGAAVVETDGIRVDEIDFMSPTILESSVDPALVSRSYGIYFRGREEVWWTVVRTGGTESRDVLVRNFKTGAIGTHRLPFNCFFYYAQSQTTIWNDLPGLWDDYAQTWDSFGDVSGSPIFLAGGHDGKVWQISEGAESDDGVAISARFKTQRINPTQDQAGDVHLGWVDVVTDSKAGATATVRLFHGYNDASYFEETVSLEAASDDANSGKVVRRVYVNQISRFHQVEVEITGCPCLSLHEIIFWMKPARVMREVA